MARRRLGAAYRLAVLLVKPAMLATTRRDWRGSEHIPRTGGLVVVANHMSYADPLVVAHFLHDQGRMPRFLGKEAVFRVPLGGRLLHGAGQIPVYRESGDANRAYRAAVEAVRRGECVVIYPEGTLTRDPGLWPMAGKTGAARVALTTGCPVVPVAHWGAQQLLAPYGRHLDLLPRKQVHVWAGPPVDLADVQLPVGAEVGADDLRTATSLIMSALTTMVGRIRGEQPPATPWDPRADDLPRTGHFTRPAPPREVA